MKGQYFQFSATKQWLVGEAMSPST